MESSTDHTAVCFKSRIKLPYFLEPQHHKVSVHLVPTNVDIQMRPSSSCPSFSTDEQQDMLLGGLGQRARVCGVRERDHCLAASDLPRETGESPWHGKSRC